MNATTTQPPAQQTVLFVSRGYTNSGSAFAEHLYDLATGLAKSGWRVKVVCDPAFCGTDLGNEVEVYPCGTVLKRGGRVGRLLGNLLWYVMCPVGILRHAGDCGTVVHLDSMFPTLWTSLGLRASRPEPLVVIAWVMDLLADKAEIEQRPGLLHALMHGLRLIHDRLFGHCDVVVVVGQCMKKYLAGRLSTESSRGPAIMSIGPWSRGDEVAPATSTRDTMRSKFGYASCDCVFMYAGSVMKWHCFDSLIEAMARVGHEEGLRCLFMASTHQHAIIRDSMAKVSVHDPDGIAFKLIDRVHRDEVGAMLSVADVQIVTQKTEYLGTCVPSKVYAAMAAGQPVLYIGSPTCQSAEDVMSCGGGIVVDEHDVEGVAQALSTLQDAGVRHEMGRRGRAAFEASFDVHHRVESWRITLAEARPTHPSLPARRAA